MGISSGMSAVENVSTLSDGKHLIGNAGFGILSMYI
jgi:hypothetical protein